MRIRAFAMLAVVAAACSAGPPSVGDRMRAVEDRLRSLVGDPEHPTPAVQVEASPAERARVAAAGFDANWLPPLDLVAMAAILELADSLQPEDWSAAIGAIGRGEHVELAWGLFLHAGIQHDFPAMARLATAALSQVPAKNRSYALGKRCELFFARRADGDAIAAGFAAAMLDLGRNGPRRRGPCWDHCWPGQPVAESRRSACVHGGIGGAVALRSTVSEPIDARERHVWIGKSRGMQ